jgi:hypothetical protein
MNVQDQVNPKEAAQQIWDQLDDEEAAAAPASEADSESADDARFEQADPATQAPAEQADAGGGEEAAPSAEQVLLDKISGLESMLGQVTQRLRNAEGHIGGLGSQLKQQVQAAQQVASQGGDAPSAKELRAAQADPEAMASLKRDYPEFASAMESALNERLQALEQRIPAQQQVVQQQGVSPEEFHRMRSELQVEVRHPGWQERVQTPEFVGWLQRQSREVQMLAASESPQDAVRLLDLHSDASSSATSQRTQRLSAAAAIPSGRSGSQVRGKAVEDMSPEEYWRYLDEVDRKKR